MQHVWARTAVEAAAARSLSITVVSLHLPHTPAAVSIPAQVAYLFALIGFSRLLYLLLHGYG
jgi:hypothetical protein